VGKVRVNVRTGVERVKASGDVREGVRVRVDSGIVWVMKSVGRGDGLGMI